MTYESAGAVFDEPDRIYRYSLHRIWGGADTEESRTVLWIMLNPSTADENVLDPTLRRCEGFTRDWGYDGFYVCNLFALRSTDPGELLKHPHPIEPANDIYNHLAILATVDVADLVICAWGNDGDILGRDKWMRRTLRQMKVDAKCLGLTKTGQPKHPLYLKKTLTPQPFPLDH